MRNVEASLWYLSHFAADEIADLFRFEGIKGNHGANSCPVSEYLFKETGERYFVFVYARKCVNGVEDDFENAVELPRSVRRFIGNFDAGCYPDLIKEEAPAWSS